MAEHALEVHSLTKKIGTKTIVDEVSFTVEKGEIFGLLGPNGAGKTTIIRMIVSLISRTGGQVIVNGHNLDESFAEAMSEIGAIVENPEFYKYMSGYKNLLHYSNMAAEEITVDRINDVTRLVALEEAINQKVRTYSLGMRQRLGVAQALLHNPSILILDEPTNGLDPQGIREFRDYLRQLANQGVSVLVSSHLLSEMQLMCDRYAIIEQGRLIHIANMNESLGEQEETQREVSFQTSDSNKALSLLAEAGLLKQAGTVKGDVMKVKMDRLSVPKANRILVSHDIDVFEISSVKATLEDRFLELTNKDKERQTI